MSRQAKLTYRTVEGEPKEVVVQAGEEASVGRHPQSTISVNQPSVSRKHARIWLEGQQFFIEDLGSSNGTYVNNQRVNRAQLSDGDDLRCGDFKMSWAEVTPRAASIASAPAGSPRLVGTLRPGGRPADAARASGPPALPSPAPQRLSPAESRPVVAAAPRPVGVLPAAPVRPLAATAPPGAPAGQSGFSRRAEPGAESAADHSAEVSRLRIEVERWKTAAEAGAVSEGLASIAQQTGDNLRHELERSVHSLERAKIEAASAVAERTKSDVELTELRSDIQDKARRMGELERAVEVGREQAATQAERSVQLTKQIQVQQAQLEAYRREKIDLEIEVGTLRDKSTKVQQALDVGTSREGELVSQMNDLKREVRQKEKGQKETEKTLEVAEYNLRAAKDEVDNLRLALGSDDGARRGLSVEMTTLKQVLGEKEVMIESLQIEVARWQLRAEHKDGDVQAAVAEQTARIRADFALEKTSLVEQRQAAMLEIERVRVAAKPQASHTAELEALVRRQAEMQLENSQLTERVLNLNASLVDAKVALATTSAGGSSSTRAMQEQINDLKRQNRDHRNELERAGWGDSGDGQSPVAPSPTDELRRTLDRLRQGGIDVLTALRGAGFEVPVAVPAPASAAPGPSSTEYTRLRADAFRVYEDINDLASELRNNVEIAQTYVADLRESALLVAGLPTEAVPEALRERAVSIVAQTDPSTTIGAAEETLSALKTAADAFKKHLRVFREVLVLHGYGSS